MIAHLLVASAFAVVPRVPSAPARPVVPGPGLVHAALPRLAATTVASLTPTALAPGLPALADSPRLPARMSRDVSRDEASAVLAVAGLPALLAEHGLTAWHILRHKTRSGERVWITVGLPREGRPFERGSGDAARRAELSDKLAKVEAKAAELVARTLGMPLEDVAFSERLLEGCCGAGCQSCLLTKDEHAELWTGEKPRRPGDPLRRH